MSQKSLRQKNVFDIVALIVSVHKEKAEFEEIQFTKNKTKKSNHASVNIPLVLSSALTHPVILSVPEKASNMLNGILQWKERFFQMTWIASNHDDYVMCLFLPTYTIKQKLLKYFKTIKKKKSLSFVASIFQSTHMAKIQYCLKYESSPIRKMTIQS